MRAGLVGLCLLWPLLGPPVARAHHGIASLGVAGLEGPGATVETSTSVTLPKGGVLGYLKLDHARFERYTPARDDEADRSDFWLFGLGYGVTSYLSAYLFLPYHVKVSEDNSFNTAGFADISLMGVLGLRYDDRLRLVPENESLDDLEDWHFSLYAGLSLPTGDADVRDRDGRIDPGLSLGFGKPSFTLGITTTKPFGSRFTLIGEASYIHFLEHEYADGHRARFGGELRLNGAAALRLFSWRGPKLRLDLNLETNYLRLGRDETDGVAEPGTGGSILYLLPGLRGYWRSVSVAVGVKLPVWTGLNESSLQQGAEGGERYRLIGTASLLF